MNPILAIDPGTEQSALVEWDGSRILFAFKAANNNVLNHIYLHAHERTICIEALASYGMPVGAEVFTTAYWIGRFIQVSQPYNSILVPRREVKLHLCCNSRAKDSNIRQALIDRFGAPGTKKHPGLTYGLKADTWQAFALAVYQFDKVVT